MTIPNHLQGFIKDDATRARFRSSYRVIGERSELSGKHIEEYRRRMINQWLVQLPGYGSVVLRENKESLLEAIDELKSEIIKFRDDVHDKLQKEIDQNREALQASLLPAVIQNPPKRWINRIGAKPSDEDLEAMLAHELKRAFGSAIDLIEDMEVRVLFKGVTYEMLNAPQFIAIVRQAIPTLIFIHEEYDAAQGLQQRLF